MRGTHHCASLLGLALLSSAAYADDNNECGAVVTSTGTFRQTDQPDHWQFTFRVVAGSETAVSSGGFTYSFTYVDSNNTAHTNNIYDGPGWAAGDGRQFDLTDTKTLVDAVSVSAIRIYAVHSGGCS